MSSIPPWTDAWILLATVYASREEPATLADVIAAADYMQHAIVTFDEMQGGLCRLVAGGYLTCTDGRLSPCESTLRFYRTITGPRKSIRTEQDDLETFLAAAAPERAVDPERDATGLLTRAEFDAAVDAYLGRHR